VDLLGLNHDFLRLESISACLEEVEEDRKGIQLVEMEGAVAVAPQGQKVLAELLALALQLA
jgi:hypothetical protein